MATGQINVLNFDRQRTRRLRVGFINEAASRVVDVKRTIRDGVLNYMTKEELLEWVPDILRFILLGVDVVSEPTWVKAHIRKAYFAGMRRAFKDFHGLKLSNPEVRKALSGEFEHRVASLHANRLEDLTDKTFKILRSISNEITRDLVDYLSKRSTFQQTPKVIAGDVVGIVDKVSERRLVRMVEFEPSKAFVAGQLDSFKELGQKNITPLIEFTASEGACSRCLKNHGKNFTVAEAEGVLPVHPGCYCAWTPA